MASLKERLQSAREQLPWLDHTLSMVSHYGSVNGSSQAGAVTYFGFLSFFPILALAFAVVAAVAHVYPDIRDQMTQEINTLLPGLVGPGSNQLHLAAAGSYSGLAGIIGLAGLLYSGLGWLSGMRTSLEVVFVVPAYEHPNFLIGKLRDLAALVAVGVTLMVSVVLSGAVTGSSRDILDWVGIDSAGLLPTVLLNVIGRALGILASTVLLLTMFRLLVTEAHLPRNALVRGALLGAVGFELLKLVANLLLASTKSSPAFQSFGVALVLLVWINYFSRLVMYSAAWAYTSPDARAQRLADSRRAPGAAVVAEGAAVDVAAMESTHVAVAGPAPATAGRPWLMLAGAAAAGALAASVVRGGGRR